MITNAILMLIVQRTENPNVFLPV